MVLAFGQDDGVNGGGLRRWLWDDPLRQGLVMFAVLAVGSFAAAAASFATGYKQGDGVLLIIAGVAFAYVVWRGCGQVRQADQPLHDATVEQPDRE